MVRRKYKFVVDCERKYCKEVQEYMKGRSFVVKEVNNTWLGDHYGLKAFKTEKDAEAEAKHLLKKCADKLYQITVIPPP